MSWLERSVSAAGWLIYGSLGVVVIGASSGCVIGGPSERTSRFCEYQKDADAVDTSEPRFSWYVNRPRRGEIQTAYQIQVATDERLLVAGAPDVWDSGKVTGSASVHVPYAGFPLRSGRTYHWRVRTWDADDAPSSFSGPASFGVGLREPVDWQARWIHVPPVKVDTGGDPPGWKHGKWIWHPTEKGDIVIVYVRRQFELGKSAKVKEARIRCTADNQFVLFVNGQKVGNGDNWEKTYDFRAAAKLRPGKNVIAAAAGNMGGLCGFRLAMRVELEDGREIWVRSDAGWKAAGREAPKWTAVDFDDGKWAKVAVIGDYGCQPWGGAVAKKRPLRSMMFRREFALSRGVKDVRRARAYVCGLGAYELHVNGQPPLPVDHGRLVPGWTQFHKRVQYQTHTVTQLLRNGPNAIGLILGNGWWHGRIGGERDQPGRDSLRLILQLDVEYVDGSHELVVVTDTDWKACLTPICKDSIYDGETYDARLEKPGWDRPGFDDADWLPVEAVDQSLDTLVPQAKDVMGVIQDIPPVSITESEPGVYIFDFGQNLVGWVRLKVQGHRGDKVVLRHAEVLKGGKFYTDNLRSAKATDVYILKGEGVEVWEPRFTYHGFRYVEVSGYPGRPGLDALVARMVSSTERQIGRFECASDLLNKIQHNILWGQRGNLYSVPTDCPQRDERLGWTGDAQVFCSTSCWNLAMARFYTKWMRDIADCQGPDGAVRDVNPTNSRSPAKPAWGDACVIVPYQVYRHYGDTRIIEENYDCMVRWVDYMTKHSKDYLYERDGYGDWIAVVPSPKKPISAAYYYYDCVLLSKMARAIGRDADADKYADLAHRIKNAFNDKYLNTETNQYVGATQTANLLPLFFGLVPLHRVDAVARNVVRDIVHHGLHLTTGFLGTGCINPVLTNTGHHDVAWGLAAQATYPSWGYMVKKGATTIWELWNSDTAGPGMNSRNHFCLGAVGQWFYESLAGIDMEAPGFRRIRIRPRPVGGLTWARASVESMYGTIGSGWELRGGNLHMSVRIPWNTTARIYVPTFGRREFTITEGGRLMVKDGAYAGSVKGITFVGTEDGAAVFRAGAGEYELVAHGVGVPQTLSYDRPPPPPAITALTDEFSGKQIDQAKWEVIDLGLESVAPSGIRATLADGRLVLSGTTGVDYWGGRTLRSRGAFSIPKGKRLEVQIDRLGLEPKGTGARTGLWLWVHPLSHIMFSQDTEAGTWSYNLNGRKGEGVKLAEAPDPGPHVMKMIHDGDSVHLLLDGKELADVAVGWNEHIRIAITAQARKKGDSLVARFDKLRAGL